LCRRLDQQRFCDVQEVISLGVASQLSRAC
jgi:hypothetical protein